MSLPISDSGRKNGANPVFIISYVLFSIGNLKPLFQAAFASCWDHDYEGEHICNAQWLNAIEYLEICGIIVGQILVGIVGDWYASGVDWSLGQFSDVR